MAENSLWGIGEKLKVKRVDANRLELSIGASKCIVFTEDLATIVRKELPEDRGAELFAEMEEKAIMKGKARVVVKAHHDIKKGDDVIFTFDITRYIDKLGNPTGVRTTKGGILF
jgi:hypothetical protein